MVKILKPKTDEFLNELPKPSRRERIKRVAPRAGLAVLAAGTAMYLTNPDHWGVKSSTEDGSGVSDPSEIVVDGDSAGKTDLHEDYTRATVRITAEEPNIFTAVDDYMDEKYEEDIDVSGMVRDIVDERGSSLVHVGDTVTFNEPTDLGN